MICEICNAKLGNSNSGKEAHMKRYHAVSSVKSVAPMPPRPMTREEKDAATKRFEAKYSQAFMLDNIEVKPVEQLIERGYNDIMGVEDVKIAKKLDIASKTPVSTPITSQEEFVQRLDALVEQSDSILAQMKKQFGE